MKTMIRMMGKFCRSHEIKSVPYSISVFLKCSIHFFLSRTCIIIVYALVFDIRVEKRNDDDVM